jgi:hypothetical protein
METVFSNCTNVAHLSESAATAYFGGAAEPNPTEAAAAAFRVYLRVKDMVRSLMVKLKNTRHRESHEGGVSCPHVGAREGPWRGL